MAFMMKSKIEKKTVEEMNPEELQEEIDFTNERVERLEKAAKQFSDMALLSSKNDLTKEETRRLKYVKAIWSDKNIEEVSLDGIHEGITNAKTYLSELHTLKLNAENNP